ncbi:MULTISPECIES: hypothetical protein [Sporomusa]|uniref:hypothetical protein n=1 Tax=Sporomusa TaxID=2375 RepID=UPI00088BF88A|nr:MULTISPECIES: hypothetical protein [Sporomusa]OZC19100.1 hypothetical protein SPACI_31860 [Sporomusa acidovorans DSM 3132]SDD67274.1 hypothetical protein SAMN04488499_100346 [Sporomusa acidovorans]HWR43477.1 hypothetical protein [Sporomusa sp.]
MAANPANDIQQCVQQCQQTAGQLRSMATQENNTQVKMMLNEGAHHLDLCIEECQYSLSQLQTPAMV